MNPKSTNVLNVINNFKKVLPLAKLDSQLNMKESLICATYPCAATYLCGTVHCHAGWYGIAKEVHKRSIELSTYCGYDSGVLELQKDLGIKDISPWAYYNPQIWGNKFGEYMFLCKRAFHSKSRPNGAENLQHIVDHWQEVYERLVILERKNSVEISEPPITAENLMDVLTLKQQQQTEKV